MASTRGSLTDPAEHVLGHRQLLLRLRERAADLEGPDRATNDATPAAADAAPRLLANTTFRRNFPETAVELQLRQTPTGQTAAEPVISRFDQLKRDNEQLRRDNHELAEHLDLAVANIQRLSLENHRLREQLEAAAKITRLDRRINPA